MSGHSKWHTIKHKKAAVDAKRGKLFTKVIKELTIAARVGGSDPEGNPRLRTALAAAKAANMPADNIKRAILKGTGELPGTTYDEVNYEGYGPGGVAILVESLTDNKMRTTPEIRHLFGKYGGNLGEPNSVAWMFARRGYLSIARSATPEDRLMEVVLEAGADDLSQDDEMFEISTSPEAFHAVQAAMERAGLTPAEAKMVWEPQNTIQLEGKKAEQCLKLLDLLEDHDDVQNVYANIEVDEAALGGGAGD
jgi:YebC/PmpR family DNA-binding regulatory protein